MFKSSIGSRTEETLSGTFGLVFPIPSLVILVVAIVVVAWKVFNPVNTFVVEVENPLEKTPVAELYITGYVAESRPLK